MKLSEFLPENTELVREGTFSSTGTLFSSAPQQVVCVARESDIARIDRNPAITCVITTPALVSKIPDRIGVATHENPRSAFYALHAALTIHPGFVLQPFANRISPSSKIHPSAVIAEQSVEIGNDVVIEKNVIIHEQTIIDEGSVVRSNSVIGSSPVLPTGSDLVTLLQPAGGVRLHREVDIHANTCIHRAFFREYTEIGEQSKIDNLDTIGQGTVIGKRCLVCAGVTIGGSVSLGDDIWIGPNVTIADNLLIGNNVYITIGSTITRDIDHDKVAKDNYTLDRKRFSRVIRGM